MLIYGLDDIPGVVCPVCEEECEKIYMDENRKVCGCNNCIRVVKAYDWLQEEQERNLGWCE